MTYITDFDGSVLGQEKTASAEWVPCLDCGARTTNLDTLICDSGVCEPPKKGFKSLGLKNGAWVRNERGVMEWRE